MRARLCLLILLPIAACSHDQPAPPDLAAPAGFCDDAAPPLPPTFDNVARLFALHCTTCHSATDVDLTRAKLLDTLVRRAVPTYEQTDESCGGLLVVPGDAGVSYLHQKLTQAQPCAGVQMPRGEFASAALMNCEQQLVTDWINAGAPGP
jgi:hypothetical protein